MSQITKTWALITIRQFTISNESNDLINYTCMLPRFNLRLLPSLSLPNTTRYSLLARAPRWKSSSDVAKLDGETMVGQLRRRIWTEGHGSFSITKYSISR
jgi:hypothetical protein